MKTTLQQIGFAKTLAIASRIATARTTLPILSNILIKAENNLLTIITTNLEISTISILPAQIRETGVIAIPARLLTEFITNLPKTTVDLATDNDKLVIKSGNYSSTINTTSADDFPEIPEIQPQNTLSLISSDFKQAVSQVAGVASSDVTRPILTGVFVHSHEKYLYFAATDGYRLAEKKLSPVSSEISAIIPATTLLEVTRILSDKDENIKISFSDDQVNFQIGDTTLISRLIDGNFINYRQLIPAKTDISATLNLTEFKRAAKISEMFAAESAGSIILTAKSATNQIEVRSLASEIGENSSAVEGEISADGQITLNSKFLLDALNQIDSDEVKFCFSGKLAPALLTSASHDDYKHIIMPVKA